MELQGVYITPIFNHASFMQFHSHGDNLIAASVSSYNGSKDCCLDPYRWA